MTPPATEGMVDPHGIGPAAARLSPASYHAAVPSLAVVAVSLVDGEQVEVLAQGMVGSTPGVVVVTERRVLVVHARQWAPMVQDIAYAPGLTVQGWQDPHTAALIFRLGQSVLQIDRIFEIPLAHEIAHSVRAKVAQQPGPPPG